MKQPVYSKRARSRSFEPHKQPQKTFQGELSDNRSRGNPQQCVEKYLTLARDAASSGDPVSAENYYQYADHYYRLAALVRFSRNSDKQKDQKSKEPSPPLDPTAESSLAQ